MIPEVQRVIFCRLQRIFQDILCLFIIKTIYVIGSHQDRSLLVYTHSQVLTVLVHIADLLSTFSVHCPRLYLKLN